MIMTNIIIIIGIIITITIIIITVVFIIIADSASKWNFSTMGGRNRDT